MACATAHVLGGIVSNQTSGTSGGHGPIERQDPAAVGNAPAEHAAPIRDLHESSIVRDAWTGDRDRLREDLRTEYYKLTDLVVGYDQRLLTVKGWGVTLSLASLGFGFQQGHYGLFLVAAASGLGFWFIEAVTKSHQIRYYPRMRDIEVASYSLYRVESDEGSVSSPLIDWGWKMAPYRWRKRDRQFQQPRYYGDDQSEIKHPERPQFKVREAFFYSSVMFPHIIAVTGGLILFFLGLTNNLQGIEL
jgi:hypothetical protein